jgi:hypothetical protein
LAQKQPTKTVGEPTKYEHIVKKDVKLSKVMRIERSYHIDSISNKTGNLTIEIINKLIKDGKCDKGLHLSRWLKEYGKSRQNYQGRV